MRGFYSQTEIDELAAVVDHIYAQGLKHHAAYRDKNLLLEVAYTEAGERVMIQAHWSSWIDERMERQRRDPRYHALLRPLLGDDIKQVTNQVHWKPPGLRVNGFRYHQDLRFRERRDAFSDLQHGYITTGLAIDAQTADNGPLRIFPDSHMRGYLGLSDEGETIMKGETANEELIAAGLNPQACIDCRLEPGDLVMWGLYTVHGSAPNQSPSERRFLLNSYCRGDSERGEWAFRAGAPQPLGDEPKLCRYEGLFDNPGPFYIEDDWYADP